VRRPGDEAAHLFFAFLFFAFLALMPRRHMMARLTWRLRRPTGVVSQDTGLRTGCATAASGQLA